VAALPAVASRFEGWSGACSGRDECSFTVDVATRVFAKFSNVRPRRMWTYARPHVGAKDICTAPNGDVVWVGGDGADALVGRLSGEDGALLWEVKLPGSARLGACAVDASGDVVVGGQYRGLTELGGTLLGGPIVGIGSAVRASAFVARLSGDDGTIVWARGLKGHAVLMDLATGDGGKLWAGGYFADKLEIGEHTLAEDGFGAFVIALNAEDGEPRWARRLGGPWYDAVHVVTAAKGGVLAVGYSECSSSRKTIPILSMLSDEGDVVWSGGALSDCVGHAGHFGAVVGRNGTVFVAGTRGGYADDRGASRSYLERVNSLGESSWLQFADARDPTPLIGLLQSDALLLATTESCGGRGECSRVFAYDSRSGSLLYGPVVELTLARGRPRSMLAGGDGRLVLAGYFQGGVRDGDEQIASGSRGFFVVKYEMPRRR